MHLVLDWTRDHVNPDDWEAVESDIFAPIIMSPEDADRVDPAVIEEEMSLFTSFTRQNRALEGGG